MSISQVVSYRI